ncbi:M1 family metallopeptidase [Lutibacter sp.]
MNICRKLTIFFFLLQTAINAQNYKQRLNSIDVQNYKLNIAVNDSTNMIYATANISVKFKQIAKQFYLDLATKDNSGKGMIVEAVFQNNDTILYTHNNNQLYIYPKKITTDSTYTYTIKYRGIPKDGLIISENLYGDRTFFGDNWPNRAHHWFPCVDHPSDKATVTYEITAPNHYQVIANGVLVEETNLNNSLNKYVWKTSVPIPTKVMVIGIANFAVQHIGLVHNVPVSTWVYPQTKELGFYDFKVAKKVLNWFIENIDEYPYSKLANVQSKTRFGGMENAGNIFYFEKSVTGKQEHEDLIAHEIAHQWFGNTASEIDWPHLWLSEGFATYFTDLYILETQGAEAFQKRMQQERTTVLNFYKRKQTPVIDLKTTNYMQLLNPNSYQKGAWVLHMLRKKLGDDLFWKGIKTYYKKYKFKNASTTQFKNVMANVSGKNLDSFFSQWLEKPGHPILKTNWIYAADKVRIIISQIQENGFDFPLDVELIYADGTTEIKTLNVTYKGAPYEISTKKEVVRVNFDPNTWLLFEMVSN